MSIIYMCVFCLYTFTVLYIRNKYVYCNNYTLFVLEASSLSLNTC